MEEIWFSRRWYQLSAIYAWGNSCVLQLNPSSCFQPISGTKEQWTKDETLHWCPVVWCERGQKIVLSRSIAPCFPIPSTLTVKGNSKAADGTTINSSGTPFFTNYCHLEHPMLSRAQGWVSVKMCLPESSKLYIDSLREQNSISFLKKIIPHLRYQEVSRDIGRHPPVQERHWPWLYSPEKLLLLQTPKTHRVTR